MPAWTTTLTSLPADTLYALRRLRRNSVTSAAGILSLALAIGACTSAFRLIDALLLRPLPIANPDRLFAVAYRSANALDGRLLTYDSSSWPAFQRMKGVVRDRARLIAVSYADRADITFGSENDIEKAFMQFVSGDLFTVFGLKPAAGRLLTASDDVTPGAHPVAVISHSYWSARFGRDPGVIGKTFRFGEDLYQIIGVLPAGFTGTETGISTDVFVPMMMKNPATLTSWNNFWLRILAVLNPGVQPTPVREQLTAAFRVIQQERANSGTVPPNLRNAVFTETLLLEPAASGRSNLQRDYRESLTALAILVTLVLLIATANLANLMTVRVMARSREMAIRTSLGAGRARLVQLVLLESAWIAGLASLAGAILGSLGATLLVRMIASPENPIQLTFPFDFRLLLFSAVLSILLTFLFGLPAAFRASDNRPSAALKGGAPHQKRRVMHVLTMAQVAFCFVVLLVAGMFARSFREISRQPLGYSPERIVNLEAVARRPQTGTYWEQAAENIRSTPGVEAVALSAWPLMSGESANSPVSIRGVPSNVFADRFMVSPGWFDDMKIPIQGGRDLRPGEARPGPAVVNQSFAKQYFRDENPIGKTFDTPNGRGSTHYEIVGIAADARYRDNLRIPIRPTFFIPFRATSADGGDQPQGRGTFVVRVAPGIEPRSLAASLRRAVMLQSPGIRVSNVRTQDEIIESKTIRERLLAILSVFFAGVAMALAAVGLYGILDFSVLQQRREIGIRLAIGARRRDILRGVTAASLAAIGAGVLLGLLAGMASGRYVESLLYRVRTFDTGILATAALLIVINSAAAALPAILRALRINPAEMLRSE